MLLRPGIVGNTLRTGPNLLYHPYQSTPRKPKKGKKVRFDRAIKLFKYVPDYSKWIKVTKRTKRQELRDRWKSRKGDRHFNSVSGKMSSATLNASYREARAKAIVLAREVGSPSHVSLTSSSRMIRRLRPRWLVDSGCSFDMVSKNSFKRSYLRAHKHDENDTHSVFRQQMHQFQQTSRFRQKSEHLDSKSPRQSEKIRRIYFPWDTDA